MTKGKGKKVATPSSKKATLALPPARYFGGRSNQFSKMGVLKGMDDGLSTADWQMLKDTRLGGNVKIGSNVSYCSALIHYFLAAHPTLALRFADKATTPMKLTRVENVPQQGQVGDCGSYALRFIKLRAEGVTDFSDVDDGFIGAYRYALATQIIVRCPIPPPTPTRTPLAEVDT